MIRSSLKVAAAATAAVVAAGAQAAGITGASVPAPLYAKWADAYQQATGNRVNYQWIGSGGGVKQINEVRVLRNLHRRARKGVVADSGATFMPLPDETVKLVGASWAGIKDGADKPAPSK